MKHLRSEIQSQNQYRLISISCREHDYRMAYLLDKSLAIYLQKIKDIPSVSNETGEEAGFSVFYYFNPIERRSYYLISNHVKDRFFISHKDLRQNEFFLIIQDENRKFSFSEIRKKILQNPEVLGVFKVSGPGNLIQNLFIALELHLADIALSEKRNQEVYKKGSWD